METVLPSIACNRSKQAAKNITVSINILTALAQTTDSEKLKQYVVEPMVAFYRPLGDLVLYT